MNLRKYSLSMALNNIYIYIYIYIYSVILINLSIYQMLNAKFIN